MKRFVLLIAVLGLCGTARAQCLLPLLGAGGSCGSSAPTLDLYLGRTGMDTNRWSGSGPGVGANDNIFAIDSTNSPLAVSTNSLILMNGEWPDVTTAANGYPAACSSHCAPTMTDSNSATLTPVFTVGNCVDTGMLADGEPLDHGFYYELAGSAVTQVTEAHPALISNSVWDIADYYGVATSSVLDGSSCKTNVTPSNNTGFNIVGNNITVSVPNELVEVAVDSDSFFQTNAWNTSPLDIPSSCTLRRMNPGITYGASRVVMDCFPPTGTFTPEIGIYQTTHDTFTIYAAGFKPGSGGSAPSTGTGDFHIASEALTPTAATTYPFNVGCPAGTQTMIVTDDSGSITAVSDSNSNTYTMQTMGAGLPTEYYKLGIGTINPNTYTITLTSNGVGVDLITFHCLPEGTLDTGFTAGSYTATVPNVTSTQVTTSTISAGVGTNTVANSGGPNCSGAVGTLVTCLGLPTGTPGESGDTIILTCQSGTGPYLQPTQPAGTVAEYVGPAALSNISVGDSEDYLNGDFGAHLYTTSSGSPLVWGWTAQQNTTFENCMATAFHK